MHQVRWLFKPQNWERPFSLLKKKKEQANKGRETKSSQGESGYTHSVKAVNHPSLKERNSVKHKTL